MLPIEDQLPSTSAIPARNAGMRGGVARFATETSTGTRPNGSRRVERNFRGTAIAVDAARSAWSRSLFSSHIGIAMPVRAGLLLMSLVALAGCSAASDQAAGSAPQTAAPNAAGQASGRVKSVVSPASEPAPAQVLETIFHTPGDRSSSYEIANGSWASYWYGQTYEVEGNRYFTGFAEQSPEHAPGAEADDPPSAKAKLGQATFLNKDGAWVSVGTQVGFAQVGGRGRADAVDKTRDVVVRAVAGGRMLLAIPTDAAIEEGTVGKDYELLLRQTDGKWGHAGTVAAGSDDSAGCDDGRAFPCAPVTGRLEIPPSDGAMPDITVTLIHGGPKPDGPQQVIYRFDPNSSQYRSTQTR